LVATLALQPAFPSLAQEIATGLFMREAGAFTGSVTRVTGEELKRFGNQNLLQSLKHLDPAFIIAEDVEHGSDPNLLPEARVRGASGLSGDYLALPASNRPLFILDGLEISARQAFDLDMNRISTVTLLKDAAARLVHGMRGLYGVVVIETVQPSAGKLGARYAGDLTVAKADLSSYDLPNAREQLQLDVNAGRYASNDPDDQQLLTNQYNQSKQAVDRGVNTNWLKQPLRAGVGHKHSFYIEDGNDHWRGGLDAAYDRVVGVMKGSYRENVAGAFTLSYRHGRLSFKNTLSGLSNHAADSPYGALSEYAGLKPYWEPRDEEGYLKRELGRLRLSSAAPVEVYFSPLYYKNNGVKHAARYTMIADNFHAGWQALDNLNLALRLGYSGGKDKREDARLGISAGQPNGIVWTYEALLVKGKEHAFHAEALLDYRGRWQKHLLHANASLAWKRETGEWNQDAMLLTDTGPFGLISGEQTTSNLPIGNFLRIETRAEEIAGVAAVNYEYDKRYLLDLSCRVDAASALNVDDRWTHYWSAGAGWNLHEEPFLKQSDWIKQLKLRGSIGYAKGDDSRLSREFNAGFDARLGKGFTARFDYHARDAGDYFVTVFVPGGMGFPSYTENLGEIRTTGFDAIVSWTVHDNPARASRLTLFASVAGNESKFKKTDEKIDDDANPAVAGYLGFNAACKGFSLDASFGYRLGGEYYSYNQTLIDQYNVSRNWLADRWGTTGNNQSSSTVRFIEKQDVNEIALSSIVLSREFGRVQLGNMRFDRTKLSLYMTDLFRLSSVKAERGLSYPFARRFSLGLQTTF
jgi:hypothetical protein